MTSVPIWAVLWCVAWTAFVYWCYRRYGWPAALFYVSCLVGGMAVGFVAGSNVG